jgi:hypothetical protein
VANVSTTVTVDLIDEITVITDPILATMMGIDVIIVATTIAMTGVTTTFAMTTTINVTTIGVIVGIIATITSGTTDEMIETMIDVAWMTTIARTIIRRNELHHDHPKGETPTVPSRRLTMRSTSSSAVAMQPKETDRPDQNLKPVASALV